MPGASVLFSKRLLLLALAACATLLVLNGRGRRITPAERAVAANTTGSFEPDGWYRGEPFIGADGVRAWGSWSGSDDNKGAITIGPFKAPRVLRFGASGYPNHAGNSLQIELIGTGRRRPIATVPIGEHWTVVEVQPPENWVGRPIQIIGVDEATGLGGWFAVSEPIRGGRGDGLNGLIESAAGWSINGLLLGLVFFASARWLLARGSLPMHWVPLAAGAIVAVCGYATFWAYFINALVGVICSWAVFGAALLALFFRRSPHSDASITDASEVALVVKLMLSVGAFYLALLHLFPSGHDFYTLAGNRFREGLPSDNMLSHELAEKLFASQPVRNLGFEWLSSDRPPLQTGWELLTWSAGKTLTIDRRAMSGTAALWFQLLWVAAAYGLLRELKIGRQRTAGWIAAMALAGFFAQNTIYTWPKLAAGSFVTGVFALLVLRKTRDHSSPTSREMAWAGVFSGLAWLAHGGVAFSLIALIPWLLARAMRSPIRAWWPAAALCVVLVAPWFAYQKFYEPPANRLLKWHLAGQSAIDSRGTWQTLRENYAKLGWRGAWSNKTHNFQGQIVGDWSQLVDLSAESRRDRRHQEFFQTARALTWWPLLAGVALVFARRPRFPLLGGLGALTAWIALTIVVWCLLMFEPYSATIHQGSYAMMLGLFALFAVIAERCDRRWLLLFVALQAVGFATTWAPGNAIVHGPMSGLPFVFVTAAGLGWWIARSFAHDTPPEAENAPAAIPVVAPPRIFESVRRWWANPQLNLWILGAFALLMFLRKPHALHTPQLWAEDGSIFLNDQEQAGLAAFFAPYMGYLHALPRIIAWLAAHLLDPTWWPAFYNGVAFAIWLAAIARLFTSRFKLPGKPWLALTFLFVPHTGEVFFNVTNLQWITAFVIIQQALIRAPTTRGERISDAVILVLVGLTGPFIAAFLPLFFWRWWRARHRDNAVALALVLACAATQAWFVAHYGPKFSFQSEPVHWGPMFEVIARRLVVWPIFGRDAALGLPGGSIRVMGALLLATIVAWTLRPHPRRWLRAQILAALALILVAGIYRARPDTWAQDNLDFGERYFYIPRVLLAWLLIWEFDARPGIVAVAARVACLAIALLHLGTYPLPAPQNYHWREHVEPIRRGVPANIPILPEGWTLEYRGRPKP